MATETKTLTAQCFCKSVHFTITVPVSLLPLATHLCNCFICRQVHGTLACFHAALRSDITPQFIAPSSLTTSVTRYRHADAASDRLFCKTCGCHIGDEDITPDHASGALEWRVATSIFAGPLDDSIFQIRSHLFTSPASSSAGLHTWLPTIDTRALATYNFHPSPSGTPHPIFPIPAPEPPKQEFSPPSSSSPEHERLRAECHCGGVSFTLPRPSHPSLASNPLVKRYTSPVDPNKWVACLDVCNDCRLLTGAHVTAWTFVPLTALEPPVPSTFTGFGTLTSYRSSEGVLRGFCGCCGATVFYSSEEADERVQGDTRIVDVAVGILRAPEGIAAEKWLTWRTGRLAFYESGKAFDRGFTEGLARGMRQWGEREHGEVLEFDIPLLM